MKHLHEVFTDQEHEQLLKAKKKANMTWHTFIMTLTKEEKETKKND